MFDEDSKKHAESVIDDMNKKISLMHDWKNTFSTDHGRRVLMDIIDSTFMYDTVFTGNSRTYYNAAFQDFGKKILDTLATADPETFVWVHKQRSNYLTKLMDDDFEAAKEIDRGRNK